MPRFYLHLWTGSEYIVDQDGDELDSAEAAYLEAFEAAREMASDLVRGRVDPMLHRFDVVDRSGRAVFELPFTEVLGRPPKARPAPVGAQDRRRVLLDAVAREIATARATMAEAQETLARSSRCSARFEIARRAAPSAELE
jgi:hypothetical protein